jgi:hypothetical protein
VARLRKAGYLVHETTIEHAEWTPQRLIRWAEQTGPNTAGVISHILERRIHPTQGYRACLGILRLGNPPADDDGFRREHVDERGDTYGKLSYRIEPEPGAESITLPVSFDKLKGCLIPAIGTLLNCDVANGIFNASGHVGYITHVCVGIHCGMTKVPGHLR